MDSGRSTAAAGRLWREPKVPWFPPLQLSAWFASRCRREGGKLAGQSRWWVRAAPPAEPSLADTVCPGCSRRGRGLEDLSASDSPQVWLDSLSATSRGLSKRARAFHSELLSRDETPVGLSVGRLSTGGQASRTDMLTRQPLIQDTFLCRAKCLRVADGKLHAFSRGSRALEPPEE